VSNNQLQRLVKEFVQSSINDLMLLYSKINRATRYLCLLIGSLRGSAANPCPSSALLRDCTDFYVEAEFTLSLEILCKIFPNKVLVDKPAMNE